MPVHTLTTCKTVLFVATSLSNMLSRCNSDSKRQQLQRGATEPGTDDYLRDTCDRAVTLRRRSADPSYLTPRRMRLAHILP